MLLCLTFVVPKTQQVLSCVGQPRVCKHHHCPGQGLPLLEVSGQVVIGAGGRLISGRAVLLMVK